MQNAAGSTHKRVPGLLVRRGGGPELLCEVRDVLPSPLLEGARPVTDRGVLRSCCLMHAIALLDHLSWSPEIDACGHLNELDVLTLDGLQLFVRQGLAPVQHNPAGDCCQHVRGVQLYELAVHLPALFACPMHV